MSEVCISSRFYDVILANFDAPDLLIPALQPSTWASRGAITTSSAGRLRPPSRPGEKTKAKKYAGTRIMICHTADILALEAAAKRPSKAGHVKAKDGTGAVDPPQISPMAQKLVFQ